MIEDDIAAVRAGRGSPDQQMTVVSVLDALLTPSKAQPDGILPDPMADRENAFSDPITVDAPIRVEYDCEGWNQWGQSLPRSL